MEAPQALPQEPADPAPAKSYVSYGPSIHEGPTTPKYFQQVDYLKMAQQMYQGNQMYINFIQGLQSEIRDLEREMAGLKVGALPNPRNRSR